MGRSYYEIYKLAILLDSKALLLAKRFLSCSFFIYQIVYFLNWEVKIKWFLILLSFDALHLGFFCLNFLILLVMIVFY